MKMNSLGFVLCCSSSLMFFCFGWLSICCFQSKAVLFMAVRVPISYMQRLPYHWIYLTKIITKHKYMYNHAPYILCLVFPVPKFKWYSLLHVKIFCQETVKPTWTKTVILWTQCQRDGAKTIKTRKLMQSFTNLFTVCLLSDCWTI